MKILVTGCAGFIGTHLCRSLLEEGHKLIGIDNYDDYYDPKLKQENTRQLLNFPLFQFLEFDILDEESLMKLPQVDLVYHLASKVGVLDSLVNSQQYYQTIVIGTQNLLNWMDQRNVKQLIYASSSSVYGNHPHELHEELPLNPLNPYAQSKRDAEKLIQEFSSKTSSQCLVFRFFSVYGPGQRIDLALNKFYHQMIRQQTIEVYGNGEHSRDYTYIDDVVDVIARCKQRLMSFQFEIINIGRGQRVSVNELIEVLFELSGETTRVKYLSSNPSEMNHTCADISKAQNLLNYSPQISLLEGVKRFLSSIKKAPKGLND